MEFFQINFRLSFLTYYLTKEYTLSIMLFTISQNLVIPNNFKRDKKTFFIQF